MAKAVIANPNVSKLYMKEQERGFLTTLFGFMSFFCAFLLITF